MRRFSFLILVFLLFTFSAGTAQVSFQISNYPVHEDGAGNQNWDITGDDAQRIFAANNHGLLVLENSDIRLHELPEQPTFRSVAYIDGRIYTGSFADFGYWENSDHGELQYTSLVPKLGNPNMNNDEIWKIIEHENKVYFHSFGSIYCYDPQTEDTYRLQRNGSFMFLHRAGDEVYTQRVQGLLYTLENDQFVPVPGSDFLDDEELKSVIQLSEESVLIGTSKGLYTYDGTTFEDWPAENLDEIIQDKINTMARTGDKIIIGTILNGLYILNLDGRVIKSINTQNQLQNNTILSIAVDRFQNIWVGMDKGLDYIAFDTPIQTYREASLDIGSVYAASLYEGQLYIGTNQGIYKFTRDRDGNFNEKTLIPNSQGQVWFIKEFDGKLYAGLNNGTYVLEDDRLRQVGFVDGGYTLKSYPSENREVLLQSTYNRLVVYEKQNDTWQQAYTLSGFATPARFLEFDHLGNIWLGHTVRGIYQLQPNISFDTIDQVRRVSPEEGVSQSTNHVYKLDNRIMVPSGDSLLQWDVINEEFTPFTELNPYFTEEGSIANVVPVGNQRYWVIKKNEISLFEIHFNSIKLLYRLLPEMYDFHLVEDYENIIPLTEDLHVICLDDGFALLNMNLVNRPKYPMPEVSIQSLDVTSFQDENSVIWPDSTSILELPYRDNTITFNWTTSQVVGNRNFFQYKLDGIDSEWNSWTDATEASYLRLPSGDYTFQVRSIGPNGFLTETLRFPFVINKPWYFSTIAYIFYFLILASFGLMARLYVSRKRWREFGRKLEQDRKRVQLEKEKADKEVIKLNNEKLQTEVEHKASQLAINTMAIIRKNNLLSNIKDKLDEQKDILGDRYPNKYYEELVELINKGVEDEREWEAFEQLYDQAHDNFFKRLKEKYPQLTPADLRLCAYLRMNLSSKEIAPLLSISVRGVEERRYRLRKRLNLSTDTNLTELIMTF